MSSRITGQSAAKRIRKKASGNEYGGTNHNYACFECRFVARRAYGMECTCPTCGTLMFRIGSRYRLPRKSDDRTWNKLKKLWGIK